MALTNNDVIKKLRVALKLRDTDIIEILKLVDYEISKTELSAFFRADDHPHYRQLKDQILRNFLNGLVIYKRGKRPRAEEKSNKNPIKALPTERKIEGLKPKASGFKYRKRKED